MGRVRLVALDLRALGWIAVGWEHRTLLDQEVRRAGPGPGSPPGCAGAVLLPGRSADVLLLGIGWVGPGRGPT
jgi:hypothetical protein